MGSLTYAAALAYSCPNLVLGTSVTEFNPAADTFAVGRGMDNMDNHVVVIHMRVVSHREVRAGQDETRAGPCRTVVGFLPFQGQGVSKHDAPAACGLAGTKGVNLRMGEGPLVS